MKVAQIIDSSRMMSHKDVLIVTMFKESEEQGNECFAISGRSWYGPLLNMP